MFKQRASKGEDRGFSRSALKAPLLVYLKSDTGTASLDEDNRLLSWPEIVMCQRLWNVKLGKAKKKEKAINWKLKPASPAEHLTSAHKCTEPGIPLTVITQVKCWWHLVRRAFLLLHSLHRICFHSSSVLSFEISRILWLPSKHDCSTYCRCSMHGCSGAC